MKKAKTKVKKKKVVEDKYNPADWDEDSVVEVIPEPRMRVGRSASIRLLVSMVNRLRKIATKKR